jgi:Putative transposase
MWFLRFPRRSVRSRFRINGRSTAFWSEPPPNRYGKSPPIPSTWGPRSASWPSSTPGAKTFNTIHMCIASCREVGWLRMARVGLPAGQDSSCRCACSAACFVASLWLYFAVRLTKCSFPSMGSSLPWQTRASSNSNSRPAPEPSGSCTPNRHGGGPEQILIYLSRYTHRVAISNQRLVDLENGNVRFHWKDYAHRGATKTMKLNATEFIRRFLLHVLPLCFVRARHYGFLANRVRQEKLALCRLLLNDDATTKAISVPKETVERHRRANVCPSCGKGLMVIAETFRPTPTRPKVEVLPPALEQAGFDTS